MICPECGYESTGNFCSNCGAPLNPDGPAEPDITVKPDVTVEPDVAVERIREPREKTRKASRAKPAKSGRRSEKADRKALQKRDERISRQLKEAAKREEQLSERLERLDREESAGSGREVYERENGGFGEAAAKGAAKGVVSLIVLAARLMQIFSCILMGYMVFLMARSFWNHQEGLGLLQNMVAERNYGLALYTGAAGVTLFMGVVWCFWILTRKAAGGSVRLKKYDTGRGFWPFLICLAAVTAAGISAPLIPADPAAYEEILNGARAALAAINAHHGTLLFASGLGAAVSFVRKLLRV